MVWPQSDLKLVSDIFDVYGDQSLEPFYTNYMSFNGITGKGIYRSADEKFTPFPDVTFDDEELMKNMLQK